MDIWAQGGRSIQLAELSELDSAGPSAGSRRLSFLVQ